MALVEMGTRLHDPAFRFGLFETLDHDRLYPTPETARIAIEGQ